MEIKDKHVVVLVGGVGGAKLALGLTQILPPEKLTIIVNTGDDFWYYGLRICTDLDTVMYTLSGLVHPEQGWGVQDESLITMDALKKFGEESWFLLGDKDLATHLIRTKRLRDGQTLTTITKDLTTALGIKHTVLPMTDSPVATVVNTVEYGEIDFQSYFVRYRWQPVVRSLRLDGIEDAILTNAVRDAIQQADILLIAPSNPWLSIKPILSIPGLNDLIQSCEIPKVAVTPIIQGQAVKGPASKLMAELGYTASAETVAKYYQDLINGFVYDLQDNPIELKTVRTIGLNTYMQTLDDKQTLATEILNWIERWQ